MLLRPAHEDVATLRRELVDYGFMTRERGIYRVATQLPERGATVSQEVGDESSGFVIWWSGHRIRDSRRHLTYALKADLAAATKASIFAGSFDAVRLDSTAHVDSQRPDSWMASPTLPASSPPPSKIGQARQPQPAANQHDGRSPQRHWRVAIEQEGDSRCFVAAWYA